MGFLTRKKSTEEVTKWFEPLDVNTSPFSTTYIENLTKNYDDRIDGRMYGWINEYVDCLKVVDLDPPHYDNYNDKLKDLISRFEAKFKEKTGKPQEKELLQEELQEELNKMKRRDFILLFAPTMPEIKNEIAIKESKQTRDSHWCWLHRETCNDGIRIEHPDNGGKSKKKSRKRNASKRRNRRTRNYKKKMNNN